MNSRAAVPDSEKVPQSWVYAFGAFRLDPVRETLTHGAEVVPLPRRLFALLLALIEANGNIVSRQALVRAMAPGERISDPSLAQHMYLLRGLLGEKARDRFYIATVHGSGFRFMPTVTIVRPSQAEVTDRVDAPPPKLLACGIPAFRHYVRGAYMLERQTSCGMQSAIKAFENAISIDPTYEPALVGLGRTYAMLGELGYVPSSYAFSNAKELIIRALRANPASAAAHAAMASVFLFSDWDWHGAQREIDQALRLNPDCVAVCVSAAWFYGSAGMADRALAQAQHALEMQPASPSLQVLMGRALIHCGEIEQAIQYFAELTESGASFRVAQRYHAIALLLANRPKEAVVSLLTIRPDPTEGEALSRSEDAAMRLPLLGRAYAESGDIDRASDIYSALLDMSRTEYVTHWSLALVDVGLGRHDKVLEHLEQSAARREPSLLLRRAPWFSAIADSPRYRTLARATLPR